MIRALAFGDCGNREYTMIEQFWTSFFDQIATDWWLWALWIPIALLAFAAIEIWPRLKRRRESRDAAKPAAKPPVRRGPLRLR